MANVLTSGVVIAGYRIDGLLGEGGMGIVYEATQLSLDRKVALKLIASELSDDFQYRGRFEREGRIQAAIDHPHIVTVYEAGESEYGLFIAMRLIRGATLKNLVLGRELDAARSLRILGQVADALDTAHEAGLIHRDIKPQNILVSRSRDHGYLADFGVMKGGGGTALTKAGQMVGTIDYMSPEQIRGESATRASDVYGLAAVLYECFTGSVPYPKDSDVAVIYAHLSDPPPRLTDARPELPKALDAVVERAMAKDPAERYPTAVAMIDAADEALGEATRAAIHIPAPVGKPEDIGIRRPEGAVTTAPGGRASATEADQRTQAADGPPKTAAPAAASPTVAAPGQSAPAAVPAAPTAAAQAPAPTAAAQAPAPTTETPAAQAPAPTTETPAPAAEAPRRPVARDAEPRRRAPLPLALVAAAGVLLLAGVGFVVGRQASDSDPPAPPPPAQRIAKGAVSLGIPSGWVTKTPPRIPGLALTGAAAIGPVGDPLRALVFGRARGAWPHYLPASYVRRLTSPDAVDRRQVVKIGNTEAFRYARLRLKGVPYSAAVYVVPRGGGSETLLCIANSPSFRASCESTIARGRVRGAGISLVPSAAYASTISRTIRNAGKRRATGLGSMRRAKTPAGQARAARAVSAAYASAARQLRTATSAPLIRPANQKVVGALSLTASAYRRLANAAVAKDEGSYTAARRSVRRAEAQLQTALGGLERIGYTLR